MSASQHKSITRNGHTRACPGLVAGTLSICILRKHENSTICHCQKDRLDARRGVPFPRTPWLYGGRSPNYRSDGLPPHSDRPRRRDLAHFSSLYNDLRSQGHAIGKAADIRGSFRRAVIRAPHRHRTNREIGQASRASRRPTPPCRGHAGPRRRGVDHGCDRQGSHRRGVAVLKLIFIESQNTLPSVAEPSRPASLAQVIPEP